MIKIFHTFIALLVFTSVSASDQLKYEQSSTHEIVRRMAFDIGSGQLKMQVSDVDVTAGKILNVLLTSTAKVPLREDLVKSLDGRLSSEIQNTLVSVISQFIRQAEYFQPTAFHAVATESLRLATNANLLVDRIKKETGLKVTIISQEEEGILGFISAINEINVNPDKAISWDFGGGSFQITTKSGEDFLVYQGKLGKVPFKNALVKIQGKEVLQTLSPNPVSKIEVTQAVHFIKENTQDIPIQIIQKLSQHDAVVLGIGIHPLRSMNNNAYYDQERVLQEIEDRLNLDDDAIGIKDKIDANYKESTYYIVSNLILAYGIMDALHIHEVHYVGTPGANAVGTLLSSKYWEECGSCEPRLSFP